MRFHIAMAEIAANPLFVAVLRMVHENVLEAFGRFSLTRNLLRENFQDLCDIVEAVEKNDADRARMLARNHVRRFNDHLKKRNHQR